MVQAMLNEANFLMTQSQSKTEQERKDMETLLSTFTENVANDQQSQNFSQGNNVASKKKEETKARLQ